MPETETIELSPTQTFAVRDAVKWYKSWTPESPPFRIFGYAGTGKTTVVDKIIEALGLTQDEVVKAAYTGKAALVMTKAGTPAHTLQSCLYIYIKPDRTLCNALFDKWRDETDKELKKAARAELDAASTPRFEINTTKSPLLSASLLVVDEVSMVNLEMREDIESFGIPLLVLGDPGQLPPIESTGALISGEPDIMLTEIHRQASGSPIIAMSIRARTGIPLAYCEDWPGRKILRSQLSIDDYIEADQIITGKNVTRQGINKMLRHVKGLTDPYPCVGDKLICLRNEKKLPLFNGLFAEVTGIGDVLEHSIEMEVKTELGDTLEVKMLRAHFDAYEDNCDLKNVKWWERRDSQEFDFGYAITVHKSQGSQWDNVLFLDDGMLKWDKKTRRRWLYTGITRAAERLTVAD